MDKRKEAKRIQNKKDKEWREAVKARDKKCVICGQVKMLNAHHIIPKQIKEFRHDIRNGVSLCPKHHRFSFELSAHQNPLIFFKKISEISDEIGENITYLLDSI